MPRKKAEKVESGEGADKAPEKPAKHKKAETIKPDMVKDIESEQPEINIGLVGHVDHGKTTLTETLTGKWTDTHSEEIKRGITIRLGYADSVFRKCPACPEPQCYAVAKICAECGAATIPLRKVSFVDAPGHESLMATMLSGANIMDGALLLVAANETCPQPQTQEHLMALQIIGVKKIIIVQNKIDLVSKEDALSNHAEIKAFIKGSAFEDAPIIPLSGQQKVGIDALIQAIEELFPTPERDRTKKPLMFVARSFDINKPGTTSEQMSGGVLGGALKQGTLKEGQEIEIRPGRKIEKVGRVYWEPIKTRIASLRTGGLEVKEVYPGGSIGVLTMLDPSIVKADTLAGSVVGNIGDIPGVWSDLDLETHLLERVVGAKDKLVVDPIKLGELLMLNVNSAATVGTVSDLSKNAFKCKLKLPVCAEPQSRVTISRRIGTRWRLIGYGVIKGEPKN